MKKRFGLLLVALLASCELPFGKLDMDKWTFKPKDTANIKIGILQPVEHSALDTARQGFIDGLEEAGYIDGQNITIDYENANGSDSDQTTLAKSLVSKNDMNLGIGTGATIALHSAQINSGKTKPILFTAVTDAVSAGLIASNDNPGGYITGTIDANPVEAQINLIMECLPEASKIGIMYTASEINSEVQANQAKKVIEDAGLTCVVKTCQDSSDIQSTITNLCFSEKVDAVYVPTDNNIAANMPTVATECNKYGILLVAGEEGQVKNGAHITLSVDYYELGKKTAEIAVQIIEGTVKPNQVKVAAMSVTECSYVYSSLNVAAAGITLPPTVIGKCNDIDEK